MDEPVWIAIGVISAIIGLGIVGSILLRGNGQGAQSQAATAVSLLAAHCDQVCGSPELTSLEISVQVPKDVALTMDRDVLCMRGQGVMACERCGCEQPPPALILNTTGAGAYYESHTFSCRATRLDTGNIARQVRFNCTG